LLGSVLQVISSDVAVDRNQLTGLIHTKLGSLTNLQYFRLGESATISSQVLDTTPLFGSVLQVKSSTVVVDGNQLLTGLVPTELGSLKNHQHFLLGKSDTISSSELVTIPLFGSVSQFISSTIVVGANQLT
jgi:hypothetical protein